MADHRKSLIDAIRQEHRHLASRIALLKRETAVWSDGYEPDFHLLALLTQFFTTFPDDIHHKKEDFIYEALMRTGVLESDYLARLKSEHEEMSGLKEKFAKDLDNLVKDRTASKQPLIDDVNKYIALQELHMADEESQFLPLAENVLPEARFTQINEKIQLDLISEKTHQTFRTLTAIDADIDALTSQKK